MKNTEKKETRKVVQKEKKLTPQQKKKREEMLKFAEFSRKLFKQGKLKEFDKKEVYGYM